MSILKPSDHFFQDNLCLNIERQFRCACEVDEFGFYHLWLNRHKSLSVDRILDMVNYFNDDALVIYSWQDHLRVVAKYNKLYNEQITN